MFTLMPEIHSTGPLQDIFQDVMIFLLRHAGGTLLRFPPWSFLILTEVLRTGFEKKTLGKLKSSMPLTEYHYIPYMHTLLYGTVLLKIRITYLQSELA